MATPPDYNCIKAIQQYITRILKPRDTTQAVQGMKCLLLDKDTKTMVSMVSSMNDILGKQVYLVDSLENEVAESVRHMKAIVITRPTRESIQKLEEHLRSPKFVEYHLFFTNFLGIDNAKRLADADKTGVVRQVQEFYIDYHAVNADLFSVSLKGSLSLCRPRQQWSPMDSANLSRCSQGLLSLLLSFKVKPYIRYLASSEACAALAREVSSAINTESQLFTFNKVGGNPLLIILDRKEDPVTPLLTQFTYQAMVHELIPGGIAFNRVNIKHAEGISKDMEEIVLSPTDDQFFRDNMYSNFGDLCGNVQEQVEKYEGMKAKHSDLSSVEAMKDAFLAMPALQKKGFTVSKHLALVTEMNKEIDRRNLLELCEIEQNMVAAGADNPGDHFRDIQNFVTNSSRPVDPVTVLRLVMLYALRYEKSRPDKVAELRKLAGERFDMKDSLNLVNDLLGYAGVGARSTSELFGGGSLGWLGSMSASVKRKIEGVQNVYAQHQPLLVGLLDKLAKGDTAKGDLSRPVFPFLGPEPAPGKFSVVIVFVVGGVTYEEAYKVAEINAGRLQIGKAGGGGGGGGGGGPQAATPPPFRVVLGGSSILNTTTYLAELSRLGQTSVSVGGGGGGRGGNPANF